jgi:hypothetical protein
MYMHVDPRDRKNLPPETLRTNHGRKISLRSSRLLLRLQVLVMHEAIARAVADAIDIEARHRSTLRVSSGDNCSKCRGDGRRLPDFEMAVYIRGEQMYVRVRGLDGYFMQLIGQV